MTETTKETRGRAIVIGAGFVGLTTSYFLNEAGFEVTCIEKRNAAALETSFQNGGLLCPGLTNPWCNWGVLTMVLQSFNPFSNNNTISMNKSLAFRPDFVYWCWTFFKNCFPSSLRHNFVQSATLSQYSLNELLNFPLVSPHEWDQTANGSLQLFESAKKRDKLFKHMQDHLGEVGVGCKCLDWNEACEVEPLLAHLPEEKAGCIFTNDTSGDIHLFSNILQSRLSSVNFMFNAGVNEIRVEDGRTKGVSLEDGRYLEADVVVVAAGNGSTQFANDIGDRICSFPIQGYAIKVPIISDGSLPTLLTSIVDDVCKVYSAPVGPDVNLSGLCIIDKELMPIEEEKLQIFLQRAKNFFPSGALDWDSLKLHTCQRPQTPDDLPVVGPSSFVKGLWYNCGHGHIGWTRGLGSSKLLAQLICGEETDLDASPFYPRRFLPVWKRAFM